MQISEGLEDQQTPEDAGTTVAEVGEAEKGTGPVGYVCGAGIELRSGGLRNSECG